MANKIHYKGKAGRNSNIRISQKGSGKKRIAIRTRGRTRIKSA